MSHPILYEAGATNFDKGLGIGLLSDAISCIVKEELNGSFELTLTYPVEGLLFKELTRERLIAVKLPDREAYQGFRIYSISRPINKTITVNAEHISYKLAEIPMRAFSAGGIQNVLKAMSHKYTSASAGYHCVVDQPFTFETNFVNSNTPVVTLETPASVRYVMGDSDKMMLDKKLTNQNNVAPWKDGEWLFDNYKCSFLTARGKDKSSYISYQYGNNVSEFTQDENLSTTVTGIFPYYHTSVVKDNVNIPKDVYGSICYGTGHEKFKDERIEVVDIGSYFEEEEKENWNEDGDGVKLPTVAQVNEKAKKAIQDFDYVCRPEVNVKISPVDLSKMSGYEDLAANLGECYIGDTINIHFSDYDIDTKEKIISVEYDVLEEIVKSLEVGDPTPNLAATIADIGEAIEANRAGIIVSKDSILLYVNKVSGELGSQIIMTDESIRSTVAGGHTDWNMIPITGNKDVGGEGLTIHLYKYLKVWDFDKQDYVWKTPQELYPASSAYAGYYLFDQSSGYVYYCNGSSWSHASWTKDHGYRRTTDTERVSGQVYYTYSYVLDKDSDGRSTGSGRPVYAQYNGTLVAGIDYYVRATNGLSPAWRSWMQAEPTYYKSQTEVLQTDTAWSVTASDNAGRSTKLEVDLNGLSSTVSDNYNTLSSSITQTNSAITTEVTNRTNADTALSSRIAQTATEISLSLSSEAVSKTSGPSITLTWKNDGGTTKTQTIGQIKLNGEVVFTNDLGASGTTTIDGGRIKTGTISADRIDVDNLTVKKLYGTTSEGTNYIQISDAVPILDPDSPNKSAGVFIGRPGSSIYMGMNLTNGFYIYRPNASTGQRLYGIASTGVASAYSLTVNDTITLGGVARSSWPTASLDWKWGGKIYNPTTVTAGGGTSLSYDSNTDTIKISSSSSGMDDYQPYATVPHGTTDGYFIRIESDGIDKMPSPWDGDDLNHCYGFLSYTTSTSTSSRRFKHAIMPVMDEELDPHRLYNMPIYQFLYNDDIDLEDSQCRLRHPVIGFIAEEVERVYPRSVQYDMKGRVKDWSERYIVPPMLALIQEQHDEIQSHEKEIQELKSEISELKQTIKDLVKIIQDKED